MSIISIELDLDWMPEDENVSDVIKQEILSSIEHRLTTTALSGLQERINQAMNDKVDQAVENAVNESIVKRIDDTLTGERIVTDKYGTVTDEKFTLEKLVIDTVKRSMDQKTINESGERTSGYSAKYTAIEYSALKLSRLHIDKQIKSMDNKIEAAVNETESKIESMIQEKIQTQVADKLTSLIMDNSTSLQLKKGDK